MENNLDVLDTEKLYLSPSNESVMAFIDGKWFQFMREDIVKKLVLPEEGEYYSLDMVDPKKPYKAIAGEDALLLNPVYNLNK